MVTAELAVALPALVLAALFALSGVQVVLTEVRCRDVAAVAARLTARGEAASVVSAAVSGRGAAAPSLSVRREGDDLVAVAASAEVHLLGLGRWLPGFVVTETAVAVNDAPAAP